ncbi:unnamed protein product [Haemonchus placei]|uniref:C2H2-type domain-containing protein n=1 Tax=Haemonchus placei TaxID=6290 RepID=A0A0N4WBK6_HAEPC|nr:unnamed protein product [Haemonchus placei]
MSSASMRSCPTCGRVLLKKNLYSHLKAIHRTPSDEISRMREQISKEAGTATVICPLCEESFATYDDFAQRCEDTCTSLFKERVRTSGSSSRVTLLCNRSGMYKRTGTQRAGVTKKHVRYCSCHLNVTFNECGTVAVAGCFGHVGHQLDPALLKFSSQQRIYLKTLLEEHSVDYIISRLRKEDPTKSTKLYFVVKQDLHNIIRNYRMAPGWRDDDDENNYDDGIRYTELPGDEGKVLNVYLHNEIVISHNSVIITPLMLKYDLRLVTLMVSNRGLPGAVFPEVPTQLHSAGFTSRRRGKDVGKENEGITMSMSERKVVRKFRCHCVRCSLELFGSY